MTFDLKIRILVLRLSFFNFHIFFSMEKAWLSLDILHLTSGSESSSACILDPRYIKSLTASIAPSRTVIGSLDLLFIHFLSLGRAGFETKTTSICIEIISLLLHIIVTL